MDEQRKQFPETQPTPGADAVKTVKVDFLLIVLLIRLLVLGCAGLHCPGGFSPVSMGGGLPSSCRVQASRSAASAARRLGGARASAVWAPRLWSTGSGLVVHRFGLPLGAWGHPLGAWDLPRSGIESLSPALAGRFLTAEPPGKFHLDCFLLKDCMD